MSDRSGTAEVSGRWSQRAAHASYVLLCAAAGNHMGAGRPVHVPVTCLASGSSSTRWDPCELEARFRTQLVWHRLILWYLGAI